MSDKTRVLTYFRKLYPDQYDAVDVSSLYDSSLTVEENMHSIQETFDVFDDVNAISDREARQLLGERVPVGVMDWLIREGKEEEYDSLVFPEKLRRPKNCKKKKWCAIDSETLASGQSFLWCSSEGIKVEYPDAEQLLSFIACAEHRDKHIALFNLNFDIDGLLRLLPVKNIREVIERGRTGYAGYGIKVIPRKKCEIMHGKHLYTITDIQPFFQSNLDRAANTWLGTRKVSLASEGVPIKRITPQDVKRHKDIYIRYCFKDCKLTARLGEVMAGWYESDNIIPRHYVSPASMSERSLLSLPRVPTSKYFEQRPKVGKAMYQTYYGGRFELWRRGYFRHIYQYDITSAYPDELRRMPDLHKGEWKYTRHDIPEAEVGCVRISGFFSVPLLPVRHRAMPLRFCVGSVSDRWITLSEYRYARDELCQEMEILEAWLFVPSGTHCPVREWVETRFRRRQATKDPATNKKLKLDLNSSSGKYMQCISMYDETLKKKVMRVGRLFNPVWASEMTARVRIKLLQYALRHEKHVIGFATDCIYSTRPIDEIPVSMTKTLGKWELDRWSDGIMVQTGVYTFRGQGGKMKHGGRGIGGGIQVNLFAHAERWPDRKDFGCVSERPFHARESLRSPYIKRLGTMKGVHNINEFIPIEKRIRINGDLKREWADTFVNCNDCMRRNIPSKPLHF